MSERVNHLREQLLHILSDTLAAGAHANELVLVMEQFIDAKVDVAISARELEHLVRQAGPGGFAG